jgi:hypothetical protein
MEAQETEISNQKQPQMYKLQCKNRKQQDNSSPSKVNSTTKDLKDSEKREISNTKF